MEATKKTSTTKTALLVIAALSMLLSGLFIATASRSDASPPAACPDGFSLTADAKNCFQAAVVTSADNPNSCDTGLLTPDGTKCYVAARVIPQEGTTQCPKGYSPDDSLGGMCARFEAATQRDDACPSGSRGLQGACYILVAKGPRGAQTCTTGTLVGGQCAIDGAAPTAAAGECPSTAIKDATGCYRLSGRPGVALVCGTNSGVYVSSAGSCKATINEAATLIPNVTVFTTQTITCPTVANPTAGQPALTGTHQAVEDPDDGHMKVGFCEVTGPFRGVCPTGSTEVGESCRTEATFDRGALQCAAAFGLTTDNKCVRYEAPVTSASQCPSGSIEDSVGDCRKPVADASGAYYCKDANAALNGKSCVFTSGFLAEASETLYKCDAGTRTVIGFGASAQVICILGDANANLQSGPSCLQGVLSTDNAYCIVPRIDTAPAAAVAAPVPSFTG